MLQYFLLIHTFCMTNGNPNPFAIEAIVNQEHILELYQFKLLVAFYLVFFFARIQLSDCIVSLRGMYTYLCYRR